MAAAQTLASGGAGRGAPEPVPLAHSAGCVELAPAAASVARHARSSCCAPAAALTTALTGAGALARGCSCGSAALLRPALSPPPAAFLGLEGSAARGPGGLRGGAATRWASMLPAPLGVAELFNAAAGWLAATCCGCGFCARCFERSFLERHFARLTSTCASCRHGAAGRVSKGGVDRHKGGRLTEALRFSCSRDMSAPRRRTPVAAAIRARAKLSVAWSTISLPSAVRVYSCRPTSLCRVGDDRALAGHAAAHLHADQQGGCLVPTGRCRRARQGGGVQVHQPAAEPLRPRRGAERRVLPRGEARREHVGARGRACRQETSCRALQGPAKPQVGLLLPA
eukprot:scaffold127499_cov48-Phaeocystis_antarctica.AAC.1